MSTESMFDVPAGDARRPSGHAEGERRDAAGEPARAAWHEAKSAARDTIASQKQNAAGGLGDLASALHSAAGQLEREQHPDVARLAHTAAGGLERVSRTLQGKDLDTLIHDTEDFARRRPLAFFAGAMAAGFLAVRFLKSSERAPVRYDRDAGRDEHAPWEERAERSKRFDANDGARFGASANVARSAAHASDGPSLNAGMHRGSEPLDIDESVGGGAWAETREAPAGLGDPAGRSGAEPRNAPTI